MNQRKTWQSARNLLLLFFLAMVFLVASSLVSPVLADKGGKGRHEQIHLAPVTAPQIKSKAQQPPKVAKTTGLKRSSAAAGTRVVDPIDLKLLVVSADGKQPGFAAITAFLQQVGIPYDTLIATQQQLVPSMLWDGGVHGYYQGIILETGALVYQAADGTWPSAFDADEWNALWEYEAMFGIRQVTFYTAPFGYPESYGLDLVTSVDTTAKPIQATLTLAGREIFPYLNAATPVEFNNAWVYLANVLDLAVTTPLLTTPEGYAIASINSANGRENLTITADHNPYLKHSMLLSYGVLDWVTKGIFLGERHVNLDIQVDDIFIDDDIWDTITRTDTTGLTYRMTGDDLNTANTWQSQVRANNATARTLALEWAFNGEGTTGIYTPDTLTPAVQGVKNSFGWVNHSFTHADLDTITRDATITELRRNDDVARNVLKLPATSYFKDAFVQPDISGLNNPAFLQGAKDFGLKYLISNTSLPEWNNPSPNAGFYSQAQPSLLIIPRRPTNLFYNLTTPDQWVSEYNYYYGPGGIWEYWDHNLTYAEILDKESDMWLSYLLKWDLDPLMFHQANLRAYAESHSLLSDLVDATLAKYNQVYNLPIRNNSEHNVGIRMAQRMAYNTSGVKASLVPGTSLTLTSPTSVLVPVTGVSYGNNREDYGGETISYVQVDAGQTVTIPLLQAPALSINDVTITEGNSGSANAVFTVSLSAAYPLAVAVNYATANGSATAGSDYTAASGTLTFAPGVTSQTVSVPVAGDLLYEADESFTVTLSSPTNATLADGSGLGTIANDDAMPALSISDVAVNEGNSATTPAVFTVTLSAVSGLPVTVAWATADGTALAGSDYTARSGTLTFAPGVTSQTVSVPVRGDVRDEADETFVVNLSNAVNATIADAQGVGTIIDNDPTPSLSINSVSRNEGRSGTTNFTFTVRLSAASGLPVTVAWATANGSATAGSDYTAAPGVLTFAAGTTSRSITIRVTGDRVVEPNETFFVNLSSPTNATLATSQGVGTIVNDD